MEKYKKIRCIYKIYNNITNRLYIGSSGDFSKRISSHLFALENNRHANSLLQKDYNNYGVESFTFSVLMRCCEKDNILKVEQDMICKCKNLYELYNKRKSCLYQSSGNSDERKFINYVNTHWLVPIGCFEKDSEKYRIYKDEDKNEIVDMAFNCDLFRIARDDLTFNRVVRMLEDTLGYEVVSGRLKLNYKKYTYKLILSYDGGEPKENLIYL